MPFNPNAYCFHPSARLKTKADFLRVKTQPKKIRIAKQPLHLVAINTETEARLGISVPKRHLKTAVARNRLKRHIRERFRLNKSQLHGFDLLFSLSQKWPEKTDKTTFGQCVTALFNQFFKRLPDKMNKKPAFKQGEPC